MDRRRFLGLTTFAAAAADWGLYRAGADAAQARELAALRRATAWLNSAALTPPGLAGKVVLVSFCTYTCINWLRTLPYLRAWSQRYQPGLVVIGVHTPEFSFERRMDNVRPAIERLKIDYPIAVDSEYAIWRAFDNQYWPALYFIDAAGKIRDRRFGEGGYEQSERTIQRLLAEAGADRAANGAVSVNGVGLEASADSANLKSPETYVGYERARNFASRVGAEPDRRLTYAAPARLALNQWALAGTWTIGREAALSGSANARIVYRFHARDVHLVMGPSRAGASVRFRVSIDGQPPGAAHGLDIDERGDGTVAEHRLFQLIRQPAPIIDRQFEIEFVDPGVEAFVFTFG